MPGKKLICILICIYSATGLALDYKYYQYTTDHGLPSSETYDIMQDSRGFIWISTDRGVSRFDGYSFTNYTTSEGLVDNVVFNMCEDDFGRIWFLSLSGNLCYFQN